MSDDELIARMLEINETYFSRSRAALESLRSRSRSEQYATRKKRYSPGTAFAIPMEPFYGGAEGTFGLAAVHSCNWLGNIIYYIFDLWADSPEALINHIPEIGPRDVTEAWETGDSMLLAGVFHVIGELPDGSLARWPDCVGRRRRHDGDWVTGYRARKLMRHQESAYSGKADPPAVNLFMAGSTELPIVRMSERQHGSPHPNADPLWRGSRPGHGRRPFRIPQDW